MTSSSNQQLAWQSQPLSALARLAWPIVVSMLSYSVMTMADVFFVSRYGAAALSGVGLGGMTVFVVISFALGLTRSVKICVSQAIGRGHQAQLRCYLSGALALALGLGVLGALLTWLAAQWIPNLSATAEAGAAARTYVSIRALAAVPMLLYAALSEARSGQGDTRSPMVASVMGNLTNVALDYVFIVVFDTGVAGAAWATVVGLLTQTGLLYWLHRRDVGELVAPERKYLRELWALGLPSGIQFLTEFGAFALVTALLAAMSDREMAAHQIAIQVIHFGFLPAHALAEATCVLTGQATGARRYALVHRASRAGLMLASVYTAFFSGLLLVASGLIATAFTQDAELASVLVRLLYVAALFQVFDGANLVARGALRGTGDVRFTAAVCVGLSWIVTPPATWWLGYQLELGALGAWLGICGEILVGAGALWWRLHTEGWRADQQDCLAPTPPVAVS